MVWKKSHYPFAFHESLGWEEKGEKTKLDHACELVRSHATHKEEEWSKKRVERVVVRAMAMLLLRHAIELKSTYSSPVMEADLLTSFARASRCCLDWPLGKSADICPSIFAVQTRLDTLDLQAFHDTWRGHRATSKIATWEMSNHRLTVGNIATMNFNLSVNWTCSIISIGAK